MTSRTALAIFLLVASWTVPVVWAIAMVAANHFGTGALAPILHLITLPFAWAVSLSLGIAATFKWAEDGDLSRAPRVIGAVFSGISGLAAFPLGLFGFARLFFPSWR